MGLFAFAKSVGSTLGITGSAEKEKVAAQQAKVAELQAAAAKVADGAQQKAKGYEIVAEQLKATVISYGLRIDNLTIRFDGTKATLTGAAQTPADREKAVLAVGNTTEVQSVDDQLTVLHPEPEALFHTVKSGDTLSKVSLDVYGVIGLYDAIFAANQPMLTHPDKIFPGQVLRIPHAEAPHHTVAAGETLGTIAKKWYGDAAKYAAIFEANRGTLTDPNKVAVGQNLTIPLVNPKI